VHILALVIVENVNHILRGVANPVVSLLRLEHESRKNKCLNYIGHHAAKEPLNCLVGAQSDQLCAPECFSEKVSESIIRRSTQLWKKVHKAAVSR